MESTTSVYRTEANTGRDPLLSDSGDEPLDLGGGPLPPGDPRQVGLAFQQDVLRAGDEACQVPAVWRRGLALGGYGDSSGFAVASIRLRTTNQNGTRMAEVTTAL
jgi:hypothetical protein